MSQSASMILILAIFIPYATCIAIGLRIYWGHVLPTLSRRGFKPDYMVFSPDEQARQVEEYGRICREEGLSLTRYKIMRHFRWLGYVLLGLFLIIWLIPSRP